MPDNDSQTPPINWRLTTFEGARREQLRRWAQLPLEDILRALEEMEDLSRQLGTAPAGESAVSAPGLIIKESSGVYGTSGANDLALTGCTPERLEVVSLEGLHTGSLGHYLAALGVLRATALMGSGHEIRGCWSNEQFVLYGPPSKISREALCNCFLTVWRPAPFERWWRKAQSESIKDPEALPKLRASQPDERIEYLDAVMVQANRRIFNDLFGTGGNIAKRNLEVVWRRCWELTKRPEARSWLEHTLFGVEDVSLPKLEGAGTWFVFANKTFNSGQNWYQEGRLSPWSFLLAMEGAFVLQGGVHRRFGTQTKGKAVFPFICHPMDPPTDGQVGHGKSEFWAPLWNKPAKMTEILMLFRVGRAEVGGRPASSPHEFAVAALDAAVEAGITAFIRFDFRQTTSAQAFEALPRETIRVPRQSGTQYSRLLLPLIKDRWIDRLPDEPRDSKQRGRFVGLRGPIEAAMVRLGEDPDDHERWRDLLQLLARVQERVDCNKALRERCNPLPRLSPSWFERAWPVPPVELQIARAVASIGAGKMSSIHSKGDEFPILFNIFGVTQQTAGQLSFPKTRPTRAVWHKGRPIRVLIDILKRRLTDASELDPAPFRGACPCGLDAIASFLAGHSFDDELVSRWIPPLALINWRHFLSRPSNGNYPLHPLYTLFRPFIAPEGITIEGAPLFPLRDGDGRKPHTAAVRMLVNHILQGNVDWAVELARGRFLAAGWKTFESSPGEMHIDPERLVAALLVPVNPKELASRFAKDWLMSKNRNE